LALFCNSPRLDFFSMSFSFFCSSLVAFLLAYRAI